MSDSHRRTIRAARWLPIGASLVLLSTPAVGQSDLEQGFAGALKGCEEWVLNPASWSDGTAAFVKAVGLGDKMGLVDKVAEVSLPPPPLRRANRYWRINSTPGAGYVLTVSTMLPMCHITGGGGTDLQPSVEVVLSSPKFTNRWEQVSQTSTSGLTSTEFRNREDVAFSIVVSRANAPQQRLDRVQVVATAQYKLDD